MNALLLILIYLCFAALTACLFCLAHSIKEKMKTAEIIRCTKLIPIECLQEISKVLEHGAKKYSPDGWKIFMPPTERDLCGSPLSLTPREWYTVKARRHIKYYVESQYPVPGSPNEDESGCHHAIHAAVNLLFVHWHDINSQKTLTSLSHKPSKRSLSNNTPSAC